MPPVVLREWTNQAHRFAHLVILPQELGFGPHQFPGIWIIMPGSVQDLDGLGAVLLVFAHVSEVQGGDPGSWVIFSHVARCFGRLREKPFGLLLFTEMNQRSEERRVGKECRSRWS